MKGIIEWHDARNELPKENGTYLVTRFISYADYWGDYSDKTDTMLYRFSVDQKIWISIDPFTDNSINALIPQGDSMECVLSWAEKPEPYDPAR